MPFKTEDLLRSCSSRPKHAKNDALSNPQVYYSVWYSIIQYIVSTMDAGKGVKLPNFGKLTFRLEEMERGTREKIVRKIPLFFLSDLFARSFNLRDSRSDTHQTHGQVACVDLNAFALSRLATEQAGCEISKETVQSVIKDIFLCMGEVMSTGQHVEIDFQMGFLVCENRIVDFEYKATDDCPSPNGRRSTARKRRIKTGMSMSAGGTPLPPRTADSMASSAAPTPSSRRRNSNIWRNENTPPPPPLDSSFTLGGKQAPKFMDDDVLSVVSRSSPDGSRSRRSNFPTKARKEPNLGDYENRKREARKNLDERQIRRLEKELEGLRIDIASRDADCRVQPSHRSQSREPHRSRFKDGMEKGRNSADAAAKVSLTEMQMKKSENAVKDGFGRYHHYLQERAENEENARRYVDEQRRLFERAERLRLDEHKKRMRETKSFLKYQMDEKEAREQQAKKDRVAGVASLDIGVELTPEEIIHNKRSLRKTLRDQIQQRMKEVEHDRAEQLDQEQVFLEQMKHNLQKEEGGKERKRKETTLMLRDMWTKQMQLKAVEQKLNA